MSQRAITREDYYKAVGLITLFAEHKAAMDAIEQALGKTLGEEKNEVAGCYDRVQDELYGFLDGPRLDRLLHNLDLTVEDDPRG